MAAKSPTYSSNPVLAAIQKAKADAAAIDRRGSLDTRRITDSPAAQLLTSLSMPRYPSSIPERGVPQPGSPHGVTIPTLAAKSGEVAWWAMTEAGSLNLVDEQKPKGKTQALPPPGSSVPTGARSLDFTSMFAERAAEDAAVVPLASSLPVTIAKQATGELPERTSRRSGSLLHRTSQDVAGATSGSYVPGSVERSRSGWWEQLDSGILNTEDNAERAPKGKHSSFVPQTNVALIHKA